jgi:hypothetical protein
MIDEKSRLTTIVIAVGSDSEVLWFSDFDCSPLCVDQKEIRNKGSDIRYRRM